MIIKSIKLVNFRQYIDTTIDFSVDPQKNITIIMGDNGTGKTTLAQAFQWALYGNTQFQIKELINRKVREKMDVNYPNNEKTVSVTLELIFNEVEYTIKRSIVYKKIGTKISESGPAQFTISYLNKENGNTEYVPEHNKEYVIRDILPRDLSRFFFFDGERIEEMSKSIQEGKGEDFKNAVYGLVGLASIQNAIEHLNLERSTKNTVIKTLRADLEANSKSTAEVKKLNDEIDALNARLEKLEDDKAKVQQELERINSAINENQRVILAETPKIELKSQYEQLVNEVKQLKKDRNSNVLKQLLKTFQSRFYGFTTIPVMSDKKVSEILELSAPEDKIIPGLHKKTIDYILETQVCLCGECLTKGSEKYKTVEALLEFAYPKTIGMLKDDFNTMRNSVSREGKDFYETIKLMMQSLADIDARIEGKEQEISEKMNMLANTEKGEEAKHQKRINEELRTKKQNELANIAAAIITCEKEVKLKISKKDTYVIVDSDSMRIGRYLAYATEIYNRMKSNYSKNENSYRLKLQDGMNHIFEEIYDGNIKITIDEKYRILVSVDEDFASSDEVERNTAQSYALIFAFIAAVIDLAKKKVNDRATSEEEKIDTEKEGYPLVMDAPLSAFDKTRIRSICTEIPQIADQVIMFIKDTDGDVAENYMHDRIGAKYMALKVNDSNLHSEVVREEA